MKATEKQTRANPRHAAIVAALAARGVELPADGKPPTIDALRASGSDVRWEGADYRPAERVYCRASEAGVNGPGQIDRLVARGYVPEPGDVRLTGCYGGPSDVIMVADRETVEDLNARKLHERRIRRGEVADVGDYGATRRATRQSYGAQFAAQEG